MKAFRALLTVFVFAFFSACYIVNARADDSLSHIHTHHDTIPNFAQSPTIRSARSGAWSDPTTWEPVRLPHAGDVVLIRHQVVYSTTIGEADTIGIEAAGMLRFARDQVTKLRVGTLLVLPQGTLEVGTPKAPIAADVTAEILIRDKPLDTTDDGIGVYDPQQWGTGLIVIDGAISIHGAVKTPTFVRLAQEPSSGDNTMALAEPVSGWGANDRLILPDTRQLKWNEWDANYRPQWEELILQDDANGVTVLSLRSSLRFNHLGARDGNGTLRFLPHVGNLTRNVMIRSENPAGTRGHVAFLHSAKVDIRYVLFHHLGRTTIAPLDNTTFDTNGNVSHIGTNHIARYPLHTHHLSGPAAIPENGYQYTLIGNAIDGGSEAHSFKWGIAIHGSHYGLIRQNVIYNVAGAGITFEDGSESFNVLEQNFVMRTVGTGFRADSTCGSDCGQEGSAFWFRGSNNYMRDNVAANAINNYGYTIFVKYVGSRDIPVFQGADPNHEGQAQTVDMNATPILEFARNEVYGATSGGMTYWWIGNFGGCCPKEVEQSIIKDLRIWHVKGGIFAYQSHRLTIDGIVVLGDKETQKSDGTYGLEFSDYLQKDLVIKNANIQNVRTGIRAPLILDARGHSTAGVTTIENSFLRNYYGIVVEIPWDSNNVIGLSPKSLIIRNVKFEPMDTPQLSPEDPQRSIVMDYSPGWNASHLIQKDTVYVYNYNHVSGDNFQVFYEEQRPDFVIPQTTYRDDGVEWLIGSPEAGLTNQQNWNKYGIAIAGAIAPCLDNTSKPEIKGFVCPLSERRDTIAPQAPGGFRIIRVLP